MKNYLTRQKDLRLRKWCVAQAINLTRGGAGSDATQTARRLYEWITGKVATQSENKAYIVERDIIRPVND